MLTDFFVIKKLYYGRLSSQGQHVNQKCYTEVVTLHSEWIRRGRSTEELLTGPSMGTNYPMVLRVGCTQNTNAMKECLTAKLLWDLDNPPYSSS